MTRIKLYQRRPTRTWSPKPEANNIFTGLFWTGKQSIALGLADKSGSLETIEEELDLDNVVNYTPVDPARFVRSLPSNLEQVSARRWIYHH